MKLTGMMVCAVGILIVSSCFSLPIDEPLYERVLRHVSIESESGVTEDACKPFGKEALPILFEIVENSSTRQAWAQKAAQLNKDQNETQFYSSNMLSRALYTIPRISNDSTSMARIYQYIHTTLASATSENDIAGGIFGLYALSLDTSLSGNTFIKEVGKNLEVGVYNHSLYYAKKKSVMTQRLQYHVKETLELQEKRRKGEL